MKQKRVFFCCMIIILILAVVIGVGFIIASSVKKEYSETKHYIFENIMEVESSDNLIEVNSRNDYTENNYTVKYNRTFNYVVNEKTAIVNMYEFEEAEGAVGKFYKWEYMPKNKKSQGWSLESKDGFYRYAIYNDNNLMIIEANCTREEMKEMIQKLDERFNIEVAYIEA